MLETIRHRLTPPRFLLLTYMFGAGIGFIQGLFVARLLGAASYGVVGILITLSSLSANFWDMRLTDLATKLHYSHGNNAQAQTASMRMLLVLNASLAFMMALTSLLLLVFGWHFFTDAQPKAEWLVIQALSIALSFYIGTVQSLQRLTDSFYAFALGKLGVQAINLCFMLALLFASPDISGYYHGLLASTVIGVTVALALLARLWKKRFGLPLLGSGWRAAWPSYRAETKFVFSANIFAYTKMLSRSGDILLFSYFASDSATGIYRLGRALADNMNIFVDAVVQYYNPRLMQLQSENNRAEFNRIARGFLLAAAAVTALAIPTAWIGLDLINSYFLHSSYNGLGLTTAILASNFIWIAGVHPWLWPALIHQNQAHRLAVGATLGALAQSALIAALCWMASPRPELAALGAIAYYLICYPALLMWWKKQ